jgi:hypothetical protein
LIKKRFTTAENAPVVKKRAADVLDKIMRGSKGGHSLIDSILNHHAATAAPLIEEAPLI